MRETSQIDKNQRDRLRNKEFCYSCALNYLLHMFVSLRLFFCIDEESLGAAENMEICKQEKIQLKINNLRTTIFLTSASMRSIPLPNSLFFDRTEMLDCNTMKYDREPIAITNKG